MVTMLQQERDRANTEARRIQALSDAKAAEVETKRVDRVKGGGLSAFATNGYTGYTGRTLGAGASLSETV